MEFGNKIQSLRNKKGWTQEKLADKLYISRTAISKWESGKGYPNISTLKDLAKLFRVSVDELLSNDEVMDIAQKENTANIKKISSLVFGFLDLFSLILIILPLYSNTTEEFIYSVSLFSTNDIEMTLKILFCVSLSILSVIGIIEFVFSFVDYKKVKMILNIVSGIIDIIVIAFFILSKQPYPATIMFCLFIIKIMILFWRKRNLKDWL